MPIRSLPFRRSVRIAASALVAFAVIACSSVATYRHAPAPVAAVQTYDYQRDIQPIFDAKCAACHGCYDAPCQLKLTSGEGLLRGASKVPVYDGARLETLPTTRLGIDAQSVEQWRQLGFFSVQHAPTEQPVPVLQASMLYRMLELGQQHSWQPNQRLPDDMPIGFGRDNSCPTVAEFDRYADKHPREGMPLGVTGLSPAEFRTLSTWIAEGAVVKTQAPQPTALEAQQISAWETWLNRDGTREKLVARYLYEHLFIAHLYFADEKNPHFYELLRSRTPPGEPLVPTARRRPNEGVEEPFWYRLRPVDGSIVEKNHIVYALDNQRLAHLQKLFLGEPWTLAALPGHSEQERANPFITFAAIPAKARYQFLLDNALFFVRSFIRGPVCAGQAATDVIRDQFWVSFEDPARELYVNDPAYRDKVSPLLAVAGQDSTLIKAGAEWLKYRNDRNEYARLRHDAYRHKSPKGASLRDIWNGDGDNRDALLTVFRHHDNAFVQNGYVGAVPETLWVMDYPLFERTYYELVVNFDVFGNVSHQLQTRLYFDLIRNDGETNFLRFLPAQLRNPLLHQWYQDGGRVKLFTSYADIDDKTPTQLKFARGIDGEVAKAAYVAQLLQRLRKVAGPDDVINRCEDGDCALPGASAATRQANRALRVLAQQTGAQLPVIPLLPEVMLLRVRAPQERLVYSLVHNRAHSNVAFITGEDDRLQPQRDTLSVVPGLAGSYPNFAFDVTLDEIEAFTTQLAAVNDVAGLTAVVERWGVRRTHPQFWTIFHDFSLSLRERAPLEAGILDMNRYENL